MDDLNSTKTIASSLSKPTAAPPTTSALLNTISPPFPLGSSSSFTSTASPTSISELLDLARKTPLPPSNQSSPLKHQQSKTKFSATSSLRATWSSRLSVSDQIVVPSADSGHSHSHSTSPSPSTTSRQVHFHIQDDTSHIPETTTDPRKLTSGSPPTSTMSSASLLPSGLSVLNSTPSTTSNATKATTQVATNRLSPSPSTSPTSRGRIVHRSMSPASRTQPGKSSASTSTSARSPIRPLSKARVPKGSPSLLVRIFDALTQSILFALGLAFLATEFAYAQLGSVLASASNKQQAFRNSRSARTTSPRRKLQTKLDGLVLWPPVGLGWFATALHALESSCGPLIGRAMFAVLVLAVGPSYLGAVIGLSIPLAMVKALSLRGTTVARRQGGAGQAGGDTGRGRKVSRT